MDNDLRERIIFSIDKYLALMKERNEIMRNIQGELIKVEEALRDTHKQ